MIRKSAGQTEVPSGLTVHIGGAGRLEMQRRVNDGGHEVFFGVAVVLVEGEVDEIACRSALEALGTDLDRRSISILSVGGLSEIAIFAELLTGLGIPAVALVDQDPGNAVSAGRRAAIAQHLPAAQLLLQVPSLEGFR